MAVVNQILHRKNTSGEYDTIYLQSNMANVTGTLDITHGGTGASSAEGARSNLGIVNYTHPSSKQCDAAAGNHTHSDATTSAAGFMSSSDKTKLNGLSNYTHPTSKQCSYTYTHPTAKQCNYSVDLSNYYTKAEVDAKFRQSERKDWVVGKTVTWDNKEWLICHLDYNVGYYLIAKDIISKTAFGNNYTYAGSTLASLAATYQSNNMSAAALAECVNVTINGVTAKVFVPSYDQMNGGFSWFNSNTNRIAKYNGTATEYWTSSKKGSSGVWGVFTDGNLDDLSRSYAGPSFGFRPCICLQI